VDCRVKSIRGRSCFSRPGWPNLAVVACPSISVAGRSAAWQCLQRSAAPRRAGLFLPRAHFRCLFSNARRQTAYDHKRDQDGNKNSKLQHVPHAFLRRPAWGGIKSCAVTPGSLAAFAAIGRVCGAGARLAIAKAKSSNPLPGSAGMGSSRKSKTRNSRPP
jgi:hypothetical protein